MQKVNNKTKKNPYPVLKYGDYQCYRNVAGEFNFYKRTIRAMLNYVVNVDDVNNHKKINFKTMKFDKLLKWFGDYYDKIVELNDLGACSAMYDWWVNPKTLMNATFHAEATIQLVKNRVDEANAFLKEFGEKYRMIDNVLITAKPKEKFQSDGGFTCETDIEVEIVSECKLKFTI